MIDGENHHSHHHHSRHHEDGWIGNIDREKFISIATEFLSSFTSSASSTRDVNDIPQDRSNTALPLNTVRLVDDSSELVKPSPSSKTRPSDRTQQGIVATRRSSTNDVSSSESEDDEQPIKIAGDSTIIFYPGIPPRSNIDENILNKEIITSSRVWITTHNGTPFSIFSTLRFSDERVRQRRKRHSVIQQQQLQLQTGERRKAFDSLKKKKAESYAHLLKPKYTIQNDDSHSMNSAMSYDPLYLDDPELRSGKHRTVITLSGYISSLVQFARPLDIKRELNEHFRQKHPDIDPTLNLSHIRSLKATLVRVALDENLELSSVARSYSYFEKLVLKRLVNKANRRVLGATCLLLACKVNDVKEISYSRVLSAMERHLGISSREVRENEFAVFAALEFSLHIHQEAYIPHFERLFANLEFSNIQEYLGARMHGIWMKHYS